MKVTIISILIAIFSCQIYAQEYPPAIVKLGVQKQYDKAKLQLYLMHCDKKLDFNSELGIKDAVTFGTLPLKFDRIILKHDTLQVKFLFQYHGEPVNIRLVKNYIAYSCFFKLPSDHIIAYSSGELNYYWEKCVNIKHCPIREVNPYQPEVLKYIHKNKDKLDPWFRKECVKKGLIKD